MHKKSLELCLICDVPLISIIKLLALFITTIIPISQMGELMLRAVTLSRKLNSNWLKHKGISWFSHQYLQVQLDLGLKLLKKLGSNFQLYFLSIISFLRFGRVDHCSFISQNDMKERGELLPDSLIKGLLIVSFQPQLFGLCSVNISKVGTWLEGIK